MRLKEFLIPSRDQAHGIDPRPRIMLIARATCANETSSAPLYKRHFIGALLEVIGELCTQRIAVARFLGQS
jgi:hypothetical protein